MDRGRKPSYMFGMNIGTRIFTWLHGRRVGSDAAGNIYYTERRPGGRIRPRRWVDFIGPPEASAIPAEWHSWLHHTTAEPLPDTGRKPWQKVHHVNATGTPFGYRPPGHDYQGGHRARATGDYESWTPGS